jgi:hypothetical protein
VARCRLLCRDLACAHRRVGCVACFPTLSLILESGAGRQPRLRSPVTCCISSDLESGEIGIIGSRAYTNNEIA